MILPDCKCGCGKKVRMSNHKFIHGHNKKGIKMSERHKRIMSKVHKGKFVSEETREKLRKAITERKHSNESKIKMSGKPLTEKQKVALSKGRMKGKVFSDKHKNRLSKAHLGNKQPEETKIKISIGMMKKEPREYCHAWYDEEYKDDCRKSACEICGLTNMLSLKVYNRQLDIHHTKGKKECAPDDFQTLCISCHRRHHAIIRWSKLKPKLKLRRRKK